MKKLIRLLLLLVLAAVPAVAFVGCQSTDQDSAVPWARPQSWEGQMPQMGGP
jgi:hypothetical protein